MNKPIHQFFTPGTVAMQHSFIREILKATKGVPGIISLAGGLPSPESFPKERLAEVFAEVIRNEGDDVLQYGTSDGDKIFKTVLKEFEEISWLSDEEMIITLGSTNGIYFFTRCMIDPGDIILCEAPTFSGSLTAMEACQARIVSVPMDEWGIEPQHLRDTLRALQQKNERVKFIYLIPEFQNPTGKTMNLQRRREVLEIAREFCVPILEDIPYRELRYTGERLPTLWELSRTEFNDPQMVVSAKSLSKILGPGLRLGMTVGPAEVIGRMVMWAQKITISPDCASQRAAARFIEKGYMKTHIAHIINLYRPRLEAMLEALQTYMPAGVHWTRPEGGMFIWVTFPEGMDTSKLFDKAIDNKVAFIPGSTFYPQDSMRRNEMRLNFSYPQIEQIHEGVKRLAKLL